MGKPSALVPLGRPKEKSTKACGSWINLQGSAFSEKQIVLRDTRGEALRYGQMVVITLAISMTALRRATGFTTGLMAADMRVTGLLMKCLAMVTSSGLMDAILKVNLRME